MRLTARASKDFAVPSTGRATANRVTSANHVTCSVPWDSSAPVAKKIARARTEQRAIIEPEVVLARPDSRATIVTYRVS